MAEELVAEGETIENEGAEEEVPKETDDCVEDVN